MAARLYDRIVRILTMDIHNPFVPIHWDEPYRFTRRIMKLDAEEWGLGEVIQSIMGGTILLTLPFFLAIRPARPEPNRPPLPSIPPSDRLSLALLGSLAMSLFIVGSSYLFHLFAPRQITLNKRAIVCTQGNSHRQRPYERIASIRFDTMQFGDKDLTVMFVNLRDGKDLVFGVSKKVNLPKAVAFLRSKGVEVVEKT